ncbi:CHAD domain-containing protein [Geobacter pickeringii]|uniref:CHAD domain-containing protein n=1 Tax=Geobacter pickeringii TaxID=345632 RepID=UPI001F2753BB|nr:CHAD domain-containing protein [Geobacter pickeringii]
MDDLFRRWKRVGETFDPEEIHDLRVSSRRLREALLLFNPAYSPDAIVRVAKKVRRVTRLLGEMRNTDEALLFFSDLADAPELPDCAPLHLLISRFEELRGEERQRLETALSSLDPAAMRSLFARTVNSPYLFSPPPAGIDPFEPFAAFARESMEQRLADLLALVPAARSEENIAAQHQLRIAVKHYRYRLEIISLLMTDGYEELHGAVKSYQETLGKMHDLDVFAGIVHEAGFPPAEEAPLLDAIAERRGRFYARFAVMLERIPLETIGERVRSAL